LMALKLDKLLEEEDFKIYDQYRILHLHEKRVRKKDIFEQDKVIGKAFRRIIRPHHPDRAGRNSNRGYLIINAYNILKRHKERSFYHDLVDSRRDIITRTKSFLCPESCDKKEIRKRRLLFAGSCMLIVGGMALSICSGGLGLPIVLCATAPAVLISSGKSGLKRLFHPDTIKNGLDCKKFLKSLLIGAGSGAISSLGPAGIPFALSELLAEGVTKFGLLSEFIDSLPGDIINDSCFSLVSDTIKKVVSEKWITAREFVFNSVYGAFLNLKMAGKLQSFFKFFQDKLNLISNEELDFPDNFANHTRKALKVTRSVISSMAESNSILFNDYCEYPTIDYTK
ncbi:Hypothetical predicted protein, partial [Paramuricea clavata]